MRIGCSIYRLADPELVGKKSNYKKLVFSFLSSIKPLAHKFQLSKIARINYHQGNLCNPQCDSIKIIIIVIYYYA